MSELSTPLFDAEYEIRSLRGKVEDLERRLTKLEEHSKVCPGCGTNDAILWNQFNQVVQCHRCGQPTLQEEGSDDARSAS